jgi:hypothetical protein
MVAIEKSLFHGSPNESMSKCMIIAQLRKISPYWGEKGPAENPAADFAPAYA